MDLTAAMKTLKYSSTYSADVSWINVKTISLWNLCFCSSRSPSTSVCLFFFPFTVAVQVSYRTTCAVHSQESTAATMTQTALQYKLYLSVTLGISPYGVPFMAPNMCSCRGPSQLANPNPIYYLWKDINSRDCDPLRLNGPLRPSIIMTSIQGGEFMWRMGYNMIYVNNAYLWWHTLPVTCWWSLINKAVTVMEMGWEREVEGCFDPFATYLPSLHPSLSFPSSISQDRNSM